ncbi:hypothetical protein MPSEU_000966800 [Mayamaea pseudoterrestris]|nr:hypothetical protein MPSEU_000966800 [Mayamaea pseudoterrestris]
MSHAYSTCFLLSSITAPPANPTFTLIADSGASAHFVTVSAPILNKIATTHPLAIQTPNGTLMHSTHEATLNIPGLPESATKAHIVPALSTHSLLSLGTLCDAGCLISFDKERVLVHYQEELILSGARCPTTGLWQMELPAPLPQSALTTIGDPKLPELLKFYHASLGSPSLRTLEAALSKGLLPHFPGLTASNLPQHPPASIAMHKGHMKALRQGIRSTKTPATTTNVDAVNDTDLFFPLQEGTVATRHHCYASFFQPTGQIYTDQTGKVFNPSLNGNQYIMVLYDYDRMLLYHSYEGEKVLQPIAPSRYGL